MKKALILGLAILAGFLFIQPNQAQANEGFGFDLGTIYFNSGETTAKAGAGSFFAFSFNIDENASVGFYNETLGLKLEDDQAGGGGTTVDINMRVSGIQACRAATKDVFLGVHAGMADISATRGAVAAFSDTVPMADVFVKWHVVSGGKKLNTTLSAVVGYRFLMIDSVDPDAAALDFVDNVDNLSGVFVGIAVGIGF